LAYAADGDSGMVYAISGPRGAVDARIAAEKGVREVRIAPGGRFGFAVNPAKDVVQIFDVSVAKVIQTADITKGPDQVTFSPTLAYIRRQGTSEVVMIPLGQVGQENAAVPVVEFTGGQLPFGQDANAVSASNIAQAPGENAVLVANAGDRAIYYYEEGMAAPRGSFQNYGKTPRAVLAVDRSLRERQPGVYESVQRLPDAGHYDVVFFLDSPRVLHCFELSVAADPRQPVPTAPSSVRLLRTSVNAIAGRATSISFEVRDPATGERRHGRVNVLVYLNPRGWQKRMAARETEAGDYELEIVPPELGTYYIAFDAPALGLTFENSLRPVLRVTTRTESP
jgi:hypothetical protein